MAARDGIAIAARYRADRVTGQVRIRPRRTRNPLTIMSGFCGAGGRIRTADLFITSESLYLLSHTLFITSESLYLLSHTSTCLAIISKRRAKSKRFRNRSARSREHTADARYLTRIIRILFCHPASISDSCRLSAHITMCLQPFPHTLPANSPDCDASNIFSSRDTPPP